MSIRLIKQNKKLMKKFLLALAIGVLAACNNSATSTEKAVDSSANATLDSIKNNGDSTSNAIDATRNVRVDSVKAGADSLGRKL